ncbi:hypothetical protein [Ferruginibacter sp.]
MTITIAFEQEIISMIEWIKKYHTVVLLFFLSSCATIINQPLQNIFIATDKNIKVISVEKAVLMDSSKHTNARKEYFVKRSNTPLVITVQTDSTKKVIVLKPKNSFAYWYNIAANYGIGMLIDRDNVKRFTYQQSSYVSVEDSSITIKRFAPIKKGAINLSLSLPFTTVFNMIDSSGKYNSAGIYGLEAGIDYFYSTNHFLSVNIGAATDVFAEHFGPGYYETGSTIYASVKNNNAVGSFDLGYGINVSKLTWSKITLDSATTFYKRKSNINIGLSLSAQYRVANNCRLGVLYQPGLLNTSFKPAVSYQHYISFNCTWKLRIKKGS